MTQNPILWLCAAIIILAIGFVNYARIHIAHSKRLRTALIDSTQTAEIRCANVLAILDK